MSRWITNSNATDYSNSGSGSSSTIPISINNSDGNVDVSGSTPNFTISSLKVTQNTTDIAALDTRVETLESVDPITDVSWHTTDGVHDRLVFQASQQVHTLKLGDGLSKDISDDFKTTTISATTDANLTNAVNTNTTTCTNLTTSVNANTGNITQLQTDIHQLNGGIYSSYFQNDNEIVFNQKTGGATWMTLQFGDNLTTTKIDPDFADDGVFGEIIRIDATSQIENNSSGNSSSVTNISLNLTPPELHTSGIMGINQDSGNKRIHFKDGIELKEIDTTHLKTQARVFNELLTEWTQITQIPFQRYSRIIKSSSVNLNDLEVLVKDDLILDAIEEAGLYYVTLNFKNPVATNIPLNIVNNSTVTVATLFERTESLIRFYIGKIDSTVLVATDNIDFEFSLHSDLSTTDLYSLGLTDNIFNQIEEIKQNTGILSSIEHEDLGSKNGNLVHLLDNAGNVVLSFHANDVETDGSRVQQRGRFENYGNTVYTASGGLTLSESNEFTLTESCLTGVETSGDNIVFTTTSGSSPGLFDALNKYTRQETNSLLANKADSSSVDSITTRVGTLESVDPITNVSWHTSDGVYDRLVFQASEQVHTLKFDGFSKSISADLKTTTIGMPLTSDYTILADELPGLVNGRNASVYRQIFPKFKTDEFTVILKFGIIDRIDGGTAWNAGINAPFLLISNDNTTTATLNKIFMLRRAQNRKSFLQLVVNEANTRNGSLNSYEDVTIENMGTGGDHYITATFGNGNFEFYFMECNNGVVTVGESYSRGSITLNYRQREPYHLTINSDISDNGGMGVDYKRFDFFSSYKTENEIKSFISEIDLL